MASKAEYKANPEKFKLAQKQNYRRNREKCLQRAADYNNKARADVISAYGGKCTACGTTEHLRLTFSNGDSKEIRARVFPNRKTRPGGVAMAKALRIAGFPQDLGVELLCVEHHQLKVSIERDTNYRGNNRALEALPNA